MKKIGISFIFIVGTLCACQGFYSLPDISKQKAVYDHLYKKIFVIAGISDEQGNNLLDSLYRCAKDDTFRIKRFDEDGEIPVSMDIVLLVDLGSDSCNRSEATERIGWSATLEHDGDIYFKFLLPPTYNRVVFNTKAGSRNSYSPDSLGNFTLSILNDFNTRIDFKFKKIGETP